MKRRLQTYTWTISLFLAFLNMKFQKPYLHPSSVQAIKSYPLYKRQVRSVDPTAICNTENYSFISLTLGSGIFLNALYLNTYHTLKRK